MSEIKIFHNPHCSKSRKTLAILEDRGLPFETVDYLHDDLSKSDLEGILKKLDMKASQLVRRNEEAFKKLNIDSSDEGAMLEAMLEHRILIERPIVITAKGAVIGRPPESVLKIL